MSSCTCNEEKGLQIVKAGFLRKYKKGFLSKGFKVVYVEITRDGYLLWYRDQSCYKRDGFVLLKEVCDYLAVGPYTRGIPGRPHLSRSSSERHLIAVPSAPGRESHVHWFVCSSDHDLNDWMSTISHVLPPLPPPPILKEDEEYFKDPPPPYPGLPQGDSFSEEERLPQDLKPQPSTTYEKAGTKPSQASLPTQQSTICAWGWTWGWGGGWGYPGWHYFSFVPTLESEGTTATTTILLQGAEAELTKNGDLQTNSDCHVTEQPCGHQAADFDTTDVDPGCDTLCDPAFDATFDTIGAAFDVGFSLGF